MTEGSIVRLLVEFAIPLLLGNIFQQLYNMVDTWVVGNYVSNEAFSAVGSVGPVINTLIGFFSGLASGAGVVISQYYGAHRYDKVHDTVHTSLVLTLVMGVFFTVVGILCVPPVLRMMKTPEEVFPESKTYLTIYFAGVLGLMLYNMGSGILRAVGDSRRPFYFLVISALINTVLDLVFVLVFGMGVEGVAYATIIAQAVSAALVMALLIRSDSCIKLYVRQLRIQWSILKQIIQVGIPAAIQMAVTAFSNIFVQSYINFFGADCMGGWTIYNKIDQLMMLPMQSFALSATTFVGQNLGTGNVKRAKKGANTTLLLAIGVTGFVAIPIVIFAPQLGYFFNHKMEAVNYGVSFLRLMTPLHIVGCVSQVYTGVLRGAGNSRTPMIITLSSMVVFRQIYLYVMANFISNTVLPIAFGYPAGWIVASAATFLYYLRVPLDKNRLVREEPAKSGEKESVPEA